MFVQYLSSITTLPTDNLSIILIAICCFFFRCVFQSNLISVWSEWVSVALNGIPVATLTADIICKTQIISLILKYLSYNSLWRTLCPFCYSGCHLNSNSPQFISRKKAVFRKNESFLWRRSCISFRICVKMLTKLLRTNNNFSTYFFFLSECSFTILLVRGPLDRLSMFVCLYIHSFVVFHAVHFCQFSFFLLALPEHCDSLGIFFCTAFACVI